MQNIKKIKKLNRIYLIFTILFVIFISTGTIYALKHFQKQTEEKVTFETNLPGFIVERVDGNNTDKVLLFREFPILKQNHVHTIEIQHKAKLTSNISGLKPLYLKIDTGFMDKVNDKWVPNNIVNPRTAIKLECAGSEYNNSQRPQLNSNGEIIVKYYIQQSKLIKSDELKNPECILISQYELVDKDGNGLEGSKTIITSNLTKIANTI